MISEILGVVLGLSMAAPPGPVNAMIANESLISKLHGSAIGLGAMTADLIFFIITFMLRNVIPKEIIYPLYVIGGALMLYLSFLILKSPNNSNKSKKGNYLTGLLLGLSNPYQISWWLTAGLFMIDEFGITIIPSFFIGILIWIFSFPFIINKIGNKYSKYVKIFSVIILLGFGIYMLFLGFKALL